MSRRWLLSLLCLSVLFLSLVQLTGARGEFRVNETATRVLFEKEPASVLLAIENSTGENLNAKVEVELLDPEDQSRTKTTQVHTIETGSKTLNLPLTISFSDLTGKDRQNLLWHRLRYRLSSAESNVTLTEGLISLSEIAQDLFEIRLSTSEIAREGGRYRARVHASHPTTQRPAANVRVEGELTLEDDTNRTIRLRAAKTTDSKGSTSLEFVMPPRFPQFPHTLQPAGGEINVTARRGGVVSEVSGEVLVDQFAKILISTDKPLYQPGQVMHMRALLFTPGKHALANHNILIRVSDPEGVNVYRTVVRSSRFGIANTDWSIPENTRLGDYRIWVGVEGDEDSSQTPYDVRISRYDLPNFSVNVETDRKFYLPGQNAEIKVRADYLFRQPVKRGQVRVVRETDRYWNYREQKWDIEEGDKYEGETDATGLFMANINLADDHEDVAYYNRRFKDVTYAVYFTDPTTNRTEQRRFDLRVTREAIHVYVMERGYHGFHPPLPLKFHVSTFYADGSPARCEVRAKLENINDSGDEVSKALSTFRTNRYGLAKVSGVSWPREFKDKNDAELVVTAVDSQRRTGSWKEQLSLDDEQSVSVETDKTLYRDGEPINAFITSTIPDQTVNIDVVRDAGVIRSERVKLHGGRVSFIFPYQSDFKDQLTIAAYPDFPKSERMVGTHTVLYPQNSELKVNLRASQESYRPGEDAQLDLSVRAPGGSAAESALGVVVLDKAVDERFRTDQESGPRARDFHESVRSFLGFENQVAGLTLRDLQRLDLSKPVSPEIELVADLLLNVNTRHYPAFSGGDRYEHDQSKIFKEPLQKQLKPVTEALANRYLHKEEYPKNGAHLRRVLLESQIDFDSLRDSWGRPYRAVFSVDQKSEVLDLISAGADERFDTADDFFVQQFQWPYFRPIGQIIDGAVRRYHNLTGGFIRDFATLRDEVTKDRLELDQLRDRWGRAYRFEFEVKDSNYVIKVSSGGPDKQFSDANKQHAADNFIIWTSSIDYFAEQRAHVNAALTRYFESTRRFPQTDEELRIMLGDSSQLFESLRDPWGSPYYRTFKTQSFYGDRLQMENRATFGDAGSRTTEITPVTRMVAYLSLRSIGPDGTSGTSDDFAVATFSSVLSEKQRGYSEPIDVTASAILSKTNGGIHGVVTDSQGAVVAGATVILARVADDVRYRTSTNEEGKYSFGNLQPGLHELRFEAMGFRVFVVTSVWARAANLTEVDAMLDVGQVSETVTIVEGSGNYLNETSASVAVANVRELNLVTKSGSQSSTPRLREYFPETLLWQPSLETDKQGRAKINLKLADNITTWKVAVVASTEDGRIGINETEIKAFQPFFVEHEPPRVLTEGDEISLPVVVRNYLEQKQNVDLEIKSENWFALLGPPRKRTAVDAGEAARETFDFRAIRSVKDGKQRITAIGTDGNDAIEKPVTVHPDGEEVSITAGDTVGSSSTLDLDLPENMVPNSSRAELRIYPHLLTHVIESVEAIMSRPYGCAEQAISSTYPSLLLLRHHKQSGEAFALRNRAEHYLKSGYSRLLNYRGESGGFGYWRDDSPDIALTAYALRFLSEAADLIAVDENVIKQARAWLIAQQQSDGRWRSIRDLKSPEDQHRSAMLTAYVSRILAMTETKVGRSSPETSAAVGTWQKLALDYLDQWARKIDEPYLLASYALAAIGLQDAQRSGTIIDKLRSLALAEGNTTYWSLKTDTPFYGWGIAGSVETTAIVLQALSRYCQSSGSRCESEPEMISRGLLFLIKHKDHYGVWYSTQATINVLDAMLTSFPTGSVTQSSESSAEILVNGQPVNTIQMPAAHRLTSPITLDLTQFLKVGKNRVEVRRPGGSPLASVQAVANFYVPWAVATATNHVQKRSNDLRLVARFDKTEARINDTIACHVEAERIGGGYGMLLAEIGLPPGADVDRSSLEAAMKGSWAIKQYDVLPDRVVVYLWPQTGGVKFDFKFRPRFGLNAKSAPSVVYDYYNPESRATVAPVTFRVK